MHVRDQARGCRSARSSSARRARLAGGCGTTLEPLEPRALLAVSLLTASPDDGRADADSGLTSSVSDDGRFVVFASDASNLALGQVARAGAIGRSDVFLHDRQTGETTLVSHAAAQVATEADGESRNPVISGDGRWIAFESRAGDLVGGAQRPAAGAPRSLNIYLFDRVTGQATLVTRSLAAGVAVVPSVAVSTDPSISRDGRYISFLSDGAQDLLAGLTDANGAGADVFLFDRQAGAVRVVSRSAGGQSVRTGDGASTRHAVSDSTVVFSSLASDLVPGQVDPPLNGAGTPDLFAFDIATGAARLLTRAAGTGATAVGLRSALAERVGSGFSVSDSGRRVAFSTASGGLATDGDDAAGTHQDVYLADLDAGWVRLISRSATAVRGAAGDSFVPRLSGDGSAVAYLSRAADLVGGLRKPTPDTWEVFHHRVDTGVTRLVSHAPGESFASIGGPGADHPRVSDDGACVSFQTGAGGMVRWLPKLSFTNYFLWDEPTGLLEPALRNPEAAGRLRTEQTDRSVLCGDGSALVFAGDVADGALLQLNLFAYRLERGPRLAVTSGALAVERSTQPGPATTFAPTLVRTGEIVREFTLWNDGVAPLFLGASPVRITGAHTADFRLVDQPPGTIEPGGSAVFRVRFDPSGPGARSATVVVEAPGEAGGRYEFELAGTGTTSGKAVLAKRGAKGDFADGATWKIGTVRGSGRLQKTLLLKNTGDATLRIERMFLRDNRGNRYKIHSKWSGTLNPGRARDLTVSLKGGRKGTWTGTLVVETDAGVVTLALSGKAR